MAWLYRINEYMERNDTFISFRKEYCHKKNKDFLEKSEENLKNYDERIKEHDPNYPEQSIENYIRKAEDLILLKRFDEVNKLDTIIKENKYPQYNVRAYFLKGFISYISKDYNNALNNYIVALYQISNSLESDWIKDIFKEIRITNNQLYGYEKGLHKTIEQIKLLLEKYPKTSLRYIAKYEIANINYLINKKQALKEFDSLLEDFKFINKEGDIIGYKGGDFAANCLIGKIKCCLYVLRNKKLTKEQKDQIIEEIEKSFELLDKLFIEKTEKSYSGRTYFPFVKFNIVVYRLKHSYYKLIKKETDFYDKAMQLFKEKRLKRFCFCLPKEKLDKFIKKYSCSPETYKISFENLLLNSNINATYFKDVDNIWNVPFTKDEIEDLVINTFDKTNIYAEKYKYLLNKYIPDLNNHIFKFDELKPISFFMTWAFPIDFIKYLVEEKKIDYKQDIDNILKYSLYNGEGYNEYLKYFIDELKVPVTYDFMAEICRYSFFSKEDFELFKYFIEEKGWNPKIKNDKIENLLFAPFKDYRFPLDNIKENVVPVIDYLVTKCNLDINEKNIYNETILYKVLSIDCHDDKNREKNKYKIVDYLFRNYKIKIDKNTRLLLQKNFIPFLKSVYKNIKEEK